MNGGTKLKACLIISILFLGIACTAAAGQTIYVDAVTGDDNDLGVTHETAFATIQKGIHSAEDGFAVLVWPGLYQEAIDFLGKAITVKSADYPAVIEAPNDLAVSFYRGENADSVLKNFVIRNSLIGILTIGSSPAIRNVTIADNVYGIIAVEAEPNISNSIFWNNIYGDLLGCQARYSCIERGGEGEGNLNINPLFADPNNGDYHLKSQAGRWDANEGRWTKDDVTSPCIDAGDPMSPIGLESFPNGGRVNMGAYGGTVEASKSYFGGPVCETLVAGDINGDCRVNFLDFRLMALHWLERVNQPPVVYITTPPDGAEFWEATESVWIGVDAWDVDGWVVKVEFFIDGYKHPKDDNDGTDGWCVVTSFNAGTYILTARATDNEGATATSPLVTITVFGNICPEVYITQPEDGAVIDYVLDTMVIEADAWDPDGSVVKVAFALDGVKFCEDNDGTDGWLVVTSPPEPGSHTLRAIATDNDGCSGTSPKITFTVE